METARNEFSNSICSYFGGDVKKALADAFCDDGLEEIRIRVNRPIQLCYADTDVFLRGADKRVVTMSAEEIQKLFEAFCAFSVYACEEETKNGFITLAGGIRVGICGRFLTENECIVRFTSVNGFNIRITREVVGCANSVIPKLTDDCGNILSTLIISEPNGGKTTLLRDISRQLSDRYRKKVCIVDERSEIAGCAVGVPQNNVGARTDVLDSVPKAIGINLAIRSLSPDVIITDEIGGDDDAAAVMDALYSGVKIIASAHANDIASALHRTSLHRLIEGSAFPLVVRIENRNGKRQYFVENYIEEKR